MEPPKEQIVDHSKKLDRYRLIFGKYRVVRVENNTMAVDLGQGIKLIANLPPYSDVREGDLLTLFTEVLRHAQTKPSPIQ